MYRNINEISSQPVTSLIETCQGKPVHHLHEQENLVTEKIVKKNLADGVHDHWKFQGYLSRDRLLFKGGLAGRF